MKRKITLLLIFCVVIFALPALAFAADTVFNSSCGANLTWTFADGVLVISGSGDMADYDTIHHAPWYDIRSDITQIEIEEGVTSIGDLAFYNCGNLTRVAIGNDVTAIGNSAFSGCSKLASVSLPSGATSIGISAFSNCSVLDNITIPGSVTNIGSSAFNSCTNLTNLVIENGVTSIGDHAFSHCGSLLDIIIPDSVTAIGIGAFNECTSLASIVLPANIISIKASTFYNCTSLSNVKIPQGVRSIENDAFRGCSELGEINIPESITVIDHGAFEGCSSLTSISIPESVVSIGYSAFENCSGLISATIGYGVTSIESSLFSGCSNLRDIALPDSVTQIGVNSFYECGSLASITIPEAVTTIGNQAFSNCSSLTSISIPENVTSIEAKAFIYCRNVQRITFEGDAPSIGSNAFYGINAFAYYPINKDTWVEGVMGSYGGRIIWYSYTPCEHSYIADEVSLPTCTRRGYTTYICSYCGKVHTEYTDMLAHSYENGKCENCGYVPYVIASGSCGTAVSWLLYSDGVLAISGQGAMYDYSLPSHSSGWNGAYAPWYDYRGNIRSVVIEEGVESIGGRSFLECSRLCSITIPHSVTFIGAAAFYDCNSLAEVTLPEGLTSIEEDLFYACSSLASLIIPESITSIGARAFADCKSMTSITIPNNPISVNSSELFSGCASLVKIEIPNNVKFLDDGLYGTFSGCSSLVSFKIPDYIRFLRGTFSRCISLTNVNWSTNLLEVGEGTFSGCNALTAIDIPDGVVIIGKGAFQYSKNLKTVSIPSSVQVIGEAAFWECEQLISIEIPHGVQSIWPRTFGNCDNLQSITIPVTVERIEGYAFQLCSSLSDVYYTGNEEQWNNILHYHTHIHNSGATIHFLETEQYADTIIENEIHVTAGGQPDWIDRFILPPYAQDFYEWLEESTDGDGKDDLLIYSESEHAGGACTYMKPVRIAAENTGELIVKLAQEEHALIDTVTAVYNLFLLEHPDVTWLLPVWGVSYCTERINDTEGVIEVGFDVYFRPIEKEEYYASVELRDRIIADIISAIPENASTIEKIRYFNAYLTRNNCYNTDYPNESTAAHKALAALVGNVGSEGPVCEAYARAFKLLCDTQNIPCAYVSGSSNNGDSHAWNLVQLEDGNWYAVDVTWNDPIVSGIDSAVSGYENENYLLIGSETVINGVSFATSHRETVWNRVPNTSLPLPEGPVLAATSTFEETFGHIAVLDKEINPTCTESGLMEGTHCYVCNEILVAQAIVPALGHNYVNGVCTRCGVHENEAEPVIISQPDSYIGSVNDDVTFAVEATGNGLTYAWFYSDDGGASWKVSHSPGYLTNTLQPILRAYRDGYLFYCRITDVFGNSVDSDVVSMVVKSSEITITEQPADVESGIVNQLYTFKVTATGDNLTYRWEYSEDGGNTWLLSWNQGYNADTLKVRLYAYRSGYLYRCVVTSGLKTVLVSEPAELILQDPSVEITAQSGSVSTVTGKTISFHVEATGNDLTYSWYRSNDKGATWTTTFLPGYNTDTLSFAANSNRAAMYMCKITDGSGKVVWSEPVKLTILSAELKILTQPTDVTCANGATASFTVEAQGDALRYLWYASSDGGETWTATYLSGYNTSTLSFTVNASRASKLYKCVITDAGGNTVETNAVSVTIG